MVRDKGVQIVLVLVFFLGVFVFNQENKVDENKQLREEILAVYQSKGEKGLCRLVKKKKDKITDKFILDFAKVAIKEKKKEKKEEWLTVCKIMAEKKKERKILAEILCATGIYFESTEDNEKAADYFQQALAIYLKLNDPVEQGPVYYKLGVIYSKKGDDSRALDMFKKALPFYEKAGEPVVQVDLYCKMGAIYSKIGYDSKALKMYDKALPFFEKAGKPIAQAKVYYCKGKIYSKIGEDPDALEMYDQALKFFKEAGGHPYQGKVYQRKGDIYLINGNISNARKMFDQALEFFKKAGCQVGQGNVYLGKGEIYLRIGDNSEALKMFDKARTLFQKEGHLVGQGNVYQRKGDIDFIEDKIPNALKMYDKALEFFEKAGQQVGQGNVYLSKGEIHSKKGETTMALNMFDKALDFFEKVGQLVGQGNVYFNKGKIYLKMGENSGDREMYDQALRMYDQALGFYKKEKDMMSESNALCGKAKVLKQQGKIDEARELYEKGIKKLEEMRTQTAYSKMKITFMETIYQRYQEIALFMLENKYHDKAFKYAESMKARVFLDQLCEKFSDLERGITTEQKEKRYEYVAILSMLSKDIHKNAAKRDEKELRELKQQRLEAEKNLENLEFKTRMDNPNYKKVKYRDPVSARYLQTKVLKKGELLLHYFISPNKLYVFVISKESFKVIPIAVQEKEINHLVNRFLPALREPHWPVIKRYGQTLYKKLLKPLEQDIKNSEYLIIIPDGELTKIPFESLIIDNDKSGYPVFFLEKYRLKYIQGASALSEMRETIRDRVAKSFIGFGDPVYDYKNFSQGKPEQGNPSRSPGKHDEKREIRRSLYTSTGGILNRLPGTGEEVKAIARLFERKNQKNVVYLREQASEDNAKAPAIEHFDIIHFACHANINDNFKGLVLSQLPSDQSGEDGYFILKEFMNFKYKAKLVVFSACQSGTGKIVKGEGIIGLTNTVMCAGIPAVVATLWDAHDTAAEELMVNFYSNMLEKGLDKTEALRQAKLELIKNKKYRYPIYWSAFIMYGE
ncbi:MAG: CHAT domain-containing protein [Candidatus Aminicenantes bacterium]|nr:MAG: CHAT domain-containing protein [Candidatus Aminicenantes bacterium]